MKFNTMLLAALAVFAFVASVNACSGEVGGQCGSNGVCCADAGCCDDGCHCDSMGCNCGRYNEKHTNQSVYGSIDYKVNEQGILYSQSVKLAVKSNSGRWEMGPIVPSEKLSKGDHVWWPTSGFSEKILEIEHYNVTTYAKNCCWSISIGIPECRVKYCCGNGCCC